MSMPGPRHTLALTRSFRQLDRIFTEGCHVRRQDAFNVGKQSDPGPDLAVVPGVPEDYPDSVPATASLIVEVSDSTLFTDTTTKAELYATAGVPDYWVIDLESRQLLVYRDPVPLPAGLGATAYRTHLAFGPEATVSPLAAPTAAIKVADLLP
jgi:Uma2 family endonuclease